MRVQGVAVGRQVCSGTAEQPRSGAVQGCTACGRGRPWGFLPLRAGGTWADLGVHMVLRRRRRAQEAAVDWRRWMSGGVGGVVVGSRTSKVQGHRRTAACKGRAGRLEHSKAPGGARGWGRRWGV